MNIFGSVAIGFRLGIRVERLQTMDGSDRMVCEMRRVSVSEVKGKGEGDGAGQTHSPPGLAHASASHSVYHPVVFIHRLHPLPSVTNRIVRNRLENLITSISSP